MGKIKEIVKKHKIELVLGVAGGAAVLAGYALGKMSVTNNRNVAAFARASNGHEFFMIRNEQYTLSDLGKLGERLIDDDHPSNYIVDHIMGFKK